jgi:hypothetical protein
MLSRKLINFLCVLRVLCVVYCQTERPPRGGLEGKPKNLRSHSGGSLRLRAGGGGSSGFVQDPVMDREQSQLKAV